MKNDLLFFNTNVNKTFFNSFIKKFLFNFGDFNTTSLLDSLKNLGFKFATKGGISLSIEDFKTPKLKKYLINESFYKVQKSLNENSTNYLIKTSSIWNNASYLLQTNIVKFFKNKDNFNNLYMISFSGARGNFSQVHQMIGMRGLMSDNKGDLISHPIISNFREGITIAEYLISSFGARKGIVDTALRTADSGYLTRRLVECAYNVLIRDIKCDSKRSVDYSSISNNKFCFEGHFIFNAYKSINYKKIYKNSHIIENKTSKLKFKHIYIRSPFTCSYKQSICLYCYGVRKISKSLNNLGLPIGLIAGQSLGEPATQMTMRTFHTGGTFMSTELNKDQFNISGFLNTIISGKFIKINIIDFKNNKSSIKLNNFNYSFFNLKDTYIKKGKNLADLNFIPTNIYQKETSFKLVTSKFSGEIFNLGDTNYNLKNINFVHDYILISSEILTNNYLKILNNSQFEIGKNKKLQNISFVNYKIKMKKFLIKKLIIIKFSKKIKEIKNMCIFLFLPCLS